MPYQLGVGADFTDAPFVEHQDAVGIPKRAQTVGDEDRGAVIAGQAQGALDASFTDVVERAGSLVENQDGCLLEQDARDGEALTLTPGKVLTASLMTAW